MKNRQEKLLKAKQLSKKLNKKMKAAGITYKNIEKDTYKAYLDIKKNKV